MNSMPRTLVYIPFHNYSEYVRECLDSVVSQTYPNQEIIASNNGSTDGAEEIVKNEYPMVKLLNYESFCELNNPGINTALKMSDCDIYMQLGMDDKLVPNFWEEILPYFSNDKIGVVRVGCYQFSKDLPEGSMWRPVPFNSPLEILITNTIFVSSPVRKAVWESIEEGYDKNISIFGDWDFWIKAILQGWKWATCYKSMFWYRRHSKSESYNYNPRINGPAYTYMRDKWMETLRKFNLNYSSMATPQMIWGDKARKIKMLMG